MESKELIKCFEYWLRKYMTIEKVFKELDKAIEETRSDYPVRIEDSKFLKKYLEIKKRYLKK